MRVRAGGQQGNLERVDALRESRENSESGPVAQLGARFHGMEEVIGSIPIRSTKQPLTNEADTGSGLAPLSRSCGVILYE